MLRRSRDVPVCEVSLHGQPLTDPIPHRLLHGLMNSYGDDRRIVISTRIIGEGDQLPRCAVHVIGLCQDIEEPRCLDAFCQAI